MKQGRESKPVAQVNGILIPLRKRASIDRIESPREFEVENSSPIKKKSRVSDEGKKEPMSANKENVPQPRHTQSSGMRLFIC
jgi:hypothetical protein